MNELSDDPVSLKALVKQLLEEIVRLKAENAELRRRLGLDSSNSHKPPSSDGYKRKTVAPGLPKKKGCCNGGQAGHKGKTLLKVSRPDRIEVHVPRQCQCCGRLFSGEDAHEIIQSRQVFELPEPKLEVTEHRIGRINCCSVAQSGDYPAEVNAPTQYGSGVRALVTMLSVEYKMPLERISQLFEDLYGYDLNSGSVLEALERGYAQSTSLEDATKTRLVNEKLVHFDETGIRVAGKLHWLHTATTPNDTYLFVHEKRGQAALNSEASLLKNFTGTAVHDCWASYFTFTNARHVLCGAHLLRELNGLKENDSLWAGEMHEFLLDLYRMRHPIVAAEEVHKHYRIILEQAEQAEPPPKPQPGKRGKPKQSPGRNLLDRLRIHQARGARLRLRSWRPVHKQPG